MKNLNIKPYLTFLIGSSFALWYLLIIVQQIDTSDLLLALKQVPMVITIEGVIALVFVKWAWRCPWFQGWLVPFPSLNGTWEGTLQSTWINPATGTSPPPIPIALVIRQTFLHTSVTLYTPESSSHSYSASFLLDDGQRLLIFSYMNTPKTDFRERSQLHHGTARLNIIVTPDKALEGEYWTDRKTTGSMSLKFFSSDIFDSLPSHLRKPDSISPPG